MNFSSINIQGNIVSSEILDKIRSEDNFHHQKSETFGLARGASLRDEIGMAWALLRTHWQTYKKRLEMLPDSDTGTSLTREKWILPFLTELGYEVAKQTKRVVDDKSYAISHGATNRDNFPIHIMGYNDNLDKRRDIGGPRLSPHALVQEYLNNTEHLFALVTNGKHLRLLRDATRLVRMSYLEFDLERMMEEELYADFSILYRVLHVSRMPEKMDEKPESVIEFYHQESLASGSRIREKLSEAVEESIKTLANGFLLHPDNEKLLERFSENRITADNYYMQQLRLVYRILFLIVLEERQLIYPAERDEETERLRKIYFNYYSIERLRKLTENHVYVDGDKMDLWQSLKTTFLLFEEGTYGAKLGIKPLGSGIFSSDALGMLSQLEMSNRDLLKVLRDLTTFYNDQKQLVRVNYSDLDVEEFGSVYEGLLEYDPKVAKVGSTWEFSFVEGDKRSSSGSHYTPEELVKPLIKHSLDYIIADKVKLSEEQKVNGEWEKVKEIAPQLENQLNALITNFAYQYENISRFNHLEYRNRDSHPDLPIKQLISQRRIVWNDFAVTPGSSFGSSQHRGGLGKKQQQRVQPLSSDSQRESERSGDTSDSVGKSGALSAKTDKANIGKSRHSRKTDFEPSTLHLSQKQLTTLWSILPHETRHSLLATHHLLSITVCDVACGSGHILLSAARKIATELASIREGAEQPSPAYYRTALRDVIKNCIYGVDYNPLAVELCKVALWLEAHNPGEPLNFLDHHIKCGNSIVGLAHRKELEKGIASEAFKTLPGDDKDFAKTLRDQNNRELKERKAKEVQLKAEFEKSTNNSVQEAMAEYKTFNKLPETTPFEIEQKQKAYDKFINGKGYSFLKAMADTQVAQFFALKTTDNKNALMTDAEFRLILSGWQGWQDRKISNAVVTAQQKRFFHWFIEFPTVMQNGGFDCILGNPPYLGGSSISTNYGDNFLSFIKSYYSPSGGQADLVTYFIRRNNVIIRNKGFFSILTTNSVSEGDARVFGLAEIIKNGSDINHAVKSIKWPGVAVLFVSILTVFKGEFKLKKYLNNKKASFINSFFEDDIEASAPNVLDDNKEKAFKGSEVIGDGFYRTESQVKQLILLDDENKNVLFPIYGGTDITNSIRQNYSNWIIYFHDWDLEKAQKYKAPIEIVVDKVKPIRSKNKDKRRREIWWQFSRPTKKLYEKYFKYDSAFIITKTAKHFVFSFIEGKVLFNSSIVVIPTNDFSQFAILSSIIHESWIRKYSSKLKTDLSYSPEDGHDTFPYPSKEMSQEEDSLSSISRKYVVSQKGLYSKLKLGLTKTYNTFHAKEIQLTLSSQDLKGKTKKEIEKQYDKEVWFLWNHLQKTEGACSWEEAVEGIEELRRLHVEMDNAVLEAYGWHEDSEKWGKAINLMHNFYEVDYLPENDRIRFTISPEARKEVLKRLLLLNHERYEEEIQQGLHKKKDVEKFYEQKGVGMPLDVLFSDAKPKKRTVKKKLIPTQTAQPSLFDTTNTNIMKEFGLHDGIYSIRDTADIINQPYNKVRRWFLKLSEANYEGLSASIKTDIENRRISFHGLVELVVIGELLEAGVKPKSIFIARKDLASLTKQPYPFATSDVKKKLKVSGSDIVFDFDEGLVTLDGSRQFNLDFIREFFADIVFESRVAIQLLPTKGHKRIQINPKAAGGRPAFVSKKNITVETIVRFYNGPDSMDEIIEDYGITKEDIEAALAYQS